MAESDNAKTFDTIELKPEATNSLPFPEFVTDLLKKMETLKQKHFHYYENLRKKNALLGERRAPLSGDARRCGISADRSRGCRAICRLQDDICETF